MLRVRHLFFSGDLSNDSHTTQKHTQNRTWGNERKISRASQGMPRLERGAGFNTTPTKHAEGKPRPHRSLVRLELRRPRRRVSRVSSLEVRSDAKAAGLRPEHFIVDGRGHAEADRGPNLRHRLEQSARDALIARP